jgi:hypothetical protein
MLARMRRGLVGSLVASLTFAGAGSARASVLTVPGQYPTPCAAIAAAKANDEVDVGPGTYTDSCEINVAGLTVKGVGGQPKIDLSGTNHPADYKGIYVVQADNVIVENLELTGANIADAEGGNAAGLRITGHDVVVRSCYIHDNQNGILAAPVVDGGTITIEYTELSHNGLGDGCDQSGCTHNVYVSKDSSTVRYDKTVFQFNWTHDLASDTADKGHLLKSRSRETDVLYNRITGETGHDSYEVDIPNGGVGIVVGNVIEKGPNADNSILLDYGEEGIDLPSTDLYVVSNTFVNDFTSSTFIEVASGATLTAHDNLFFGPGTLASTGSLSADNLATSAPLFVSASTFDYHLTAGSPGIGKAIAPGTAGSFSLLPVFEYVQPLGSTPRKADHDLGAFEYTTAGDGGGASSGTGMGTATGTDERTSTARASTRDSTSGGAVSTGDGGGGGAADAGLEPDKSGGCGCVVARRDVNSSAAGGGLLSLLVGLMARRRRHPISGA